MTRPRTLVPRGRMVGGRFALADRFELKSRAHAKRMGCRCAPEVEVHPPGHARLFTLRHSRRCPITTRGFGL